MQFNELKNGQKFQLPGSGMAMERGALFEKKGARSYVQISPRDAFWGMEIKPRSLALEVKEIA